MIVEHESNPLSVNVTGVAEAGFPSLQVELPRITVILGANGVGKSNLLRHLCAIPEVWSQVVEITYVEGGRVMPPPSTLRLDRKTIDTYGSLKQTKASHNDQRTKPLSNRIQSAFFCLQQEGEAVTRSHSDAVVEWSNAGQQGDCPRRDHEPLERLFDLFNELFPDVVICLEQESKEIVCRKSGADYGPGQLSDGEKQCLCLLADLAFLTNRRSTIIVDEPELNLHPTLANEVWTLIEEERPLARFLYATHSLSFAMRSAVNQVVVLSAGGASETYSDLAEVPSHELRPFLGAIPAILSASRALAVEGEETSFDRIFYGWVVGTSDFATVPLGGCDEVVAACTHVGIWDRVASGVTIGGVVDRDYRAESRTKATPNDTIATLRFHEAESYLCLPEVVARIAESVGTVDDPPTKEDVLGIIVEFLADSVLQTSARRTFARAGMHLAVSVDRKAIAAASDEESMITLIRQAASKEQEKAENLAPDKVEGIFQEELTLCREALASRDSRRILRIFPGKELLGKLAPMMGCSSPSAVARGAKTHIDLTEIPELTELRSALRAILSLDEPSGDTIHNV